LLTTVECAGQLVTEAAQEVMVTSLVEYTVDWAMTAVAMTATAATENCILIDLIYWVGGKGRGIVKC
jgi:hypothetical protein